MHSGPHERRLINDLMDKYNNLERPVFNETEPLVLTFGLTLQQIIDVVSCLVSSPKYGASFFKKRASLSRKVHLCS